MVTETIFLTENGTKIERAPSDKSSVYAVSRLFNQDSNAQKCVIIYAHFSENGILIDLRSESIEMAAGSELVKSECFMLEDKKESIEVYLWDGFQQMKPITTVVRLGV